MGETASKSKLGDLALFRRLLGEARGYWPHIAVIFVLDLVAAPIALLVPVPMKIAIDSVIGDKPLPWFVAPLVGDATAGSKEALLVFAVSAMVVIALLTHLQILAVWMLKVYTSERMVLGFRSRLFRHVQGLSLGFHDSKGTSDSVYRIQYDATAIEGVTIGGVVPVITAILTLFAMIYVTTRIDWQMTVIALAIAPVLVLLAQYYRGRLRDQWSTTKEAESSVLGVVQEVLSTLRVVKAFGQEERELDRFTNRADASLRAKIRATFTQSVFGLMMGLLVSAGAAVVFAVGVRHVQAGALTLGELVLVMLYLGMLYKPVETLGMKAATLQGSFASADRAFSLLGEPPEVLERPRAKALHRAQGRISFQNVCFCYGENAPVLEDVSFEAGPGQCIGLSGETGAGKSTLVSLLPRFYDPSAGQVLLDDVDLRGYRLDDLRRQFAIVLQDTVLFSTTIAENVAYGRPDASEDEVVAAAKLANAHDFIARLSEGYDTEVGERGMLLSGGERQRIALARAFLRGAPILILDEPTSAVDVRTEGVVLEALERLLEGRTTFLISHRAKTMDYCDRVLIVRGGRLVAE